VKDFIQVPDTWKKLLKATEPSFHSGIRLGVSHLSEIKTASLATRHFFVDDMLAWIVPAIQDIVRDISQHIEVQTRFLNELDSAATTVQVTTRNSLLDSQFVSPQRPHWASDYFKRSTASSSFLYMAVHLQLLDYVKFTVQSFHAPNRNEVLSSLLEVAVTKHRPRTLDISPEQPSLEIIKFLLEQGADPNHPTYLSYLGHTIWEVAMQDYSTDSDVLAQLLDYGADPLAPSLSSSDCRASLSPVLEYKQREAQRHRGERNLEV